MAKRYYYKSKNGEAWWNLKTPDFARDQDKVEITKEEWDAHIIELEKAKE